MHKIEGPGATEDNRFTEGNPSSGAEATTVSAAWLNAVQGEIVKVIEAAGLTLQAEDTETSDQLLAALGALAPAQNIAVFDVAGTTEWTVPEVLKKGLCKAHVTAIGGGGGAARSDGSLGSGGGGGGGIAFGNVDLANVSSVTVTVGSGGAGGSSSGASGQSGGASSFGAYLSATGGAGSANPFGTLGSGGGGGVGSGGDFNTTYGSGQSSTTGEGAPGGGPGGHISRSDVPGHNGIGPGGGGGGARPGFDGGSGADGIVIVRW